MPPKLLYALEAADGHCFPAHPECPGRVHAIAGALGRLLADDNGTEEVLQLIDYAPASVAEERLAAVHTQRHIRAVREAATVAQGPTAVRDPDDPDGPTFVTPSSYSDALRAVSAALALADAVVAASVHERGAGGSGRPPAALSLCRPPGHHAMREEGMGFCLFNTVAIVARHLQWQHGLSRVLILDWDVHHGNGTQDIFFDDPSVFFIDVHQADVWPGSGTLGEAGAGAGRGATINVPLPWYSGHVAMQQVFEAVVAPAARRFRPDFILVSAGFDAHARDPLERLQAQSATYHWPAAALLRLAAELCGGRLLLLLEGGYHQDALAESVAEVAAALLGRPPTTALAAPGELPEPEPLQAVAAVLAQVAALHDLGSGPGQGLGEGAAGGLHA